MIRNHGRKNVENELKEWVKDCALETMLKMNADVDLTGFNEQDECLSEIGGIDGIMDEALHWAVYCLGRDYEDRSIVVDSMRWERRGETVHCDFTYKGGKPIKDNDDIMKDKDFICYATLCSCFALSPNSLRYWKLTNLKSRLEYRYKGCNLDEYVEKMYPHEG